MFICKYELEFEFNDFKLIIHITSQKYENVNKIIQS